MKTPLRAAVVFIAAGGLLSAVAFAQFGNPGGGMTTSSNNVTSAALGNIVAKATGGAATTAAALANIVSAATGCGSNVKFVLENGTCTTPTTAITASSTNDSAAAGNLGAVLSTKCPGVANQTATFTNGSTSITLATSDITVGCPVNFTTTISLPTNFATATNYYVLTDAAKVITVAAAPGGSAISAGSAGSGVQTAVSSGALLTTGSSVNVAGLALTAGNWLCSYQDSTTPASTMTILKRGLNTTSATLPAVTDLSYYSTAAALTSAAVEANTMGIIQENQSGAAELYLVNNDTFASTATALGSIICWRPR